MNFDPGWRAAGAPAENWHGLVGAKVTGGDELVEISYRPKGLTAGLFLFAAHGRSRRGSCSCASVEATASTELSA